MKQKQKGRPAPLAPIAIPDWKVDKNQRVIPIRDANFWRPGPNGSIDCLLCYRLCHLERGQTGWCQYRGNERGKMALTAHGIITCAVRAMAGYGVDPFLT